MQHAERPEFCQASCKPLGVVLNDVDLNKVATTKIITINIIGPDILMVQTQKARRTPKLLPLFTHPVILVINNDHSPSENGAA